MSLKAKIEAVIYASEEPVTLAQLVGLLGQETQLELDRLDARQQNLHLAGHGDLPSGEELPGSDTATAEADGFEIEPSATPAELTEDHVPHASTVPPSIDESADTSEPVQESPALPAPGLASDPNQEKRIARERDRKLRDFLRDTVTQLIRDYAESDRGLEVREVAGGYRMATKPEYHDAVRGFVKSLKPPLTLTLQSLETLAVVAYKQPVTAPEISEIRGVDSSGVLGSLMARKLITTAGRKQVIGRPILYKTTKDFLLRFGLKDVSELPSMEEFEKMAGELAEQEEIPMPDHVDPSKPETTLARITHENLQEGVHTKEPQADGDSTPFAPFASVFDDSNLAPGDLPTIDGRLSALPPSDLQPGEDPSADEAAIQQDEAAQ